MPDVYHLTRVLYRTDATVEEPEYIGSFSSSIPESALRNSQIVNVDWSIRGWVEVTYLRSGAQDGGNVPYPGA
jgi:hypothetical protein